MSSDNGDKQADGKPPSVPLVALALAFVVFMVAVHFYGCWLICRRCCYRRRFTSSNTIYAATVSSHSDVKLNPAVLASLPTFVYPGDELREMVECSVCLTEFKDGENRWLFPMCRHRFHVECIDMWLVSHSTCPLCRSTVEAGVCNPPPP